MKVWNTIVKIITVLAVVAGIVYVIATYGDKIAVWAKKLLNKAADFCGIRCSCHCQCTCGDECCCEEAAVEEAPAEEADFES